MHFCRNFYRNFLLISDVHKIDVGKYRIGPIVVMLAEYQYFIKPNNYAFPVVGLCFHIGETSFFRLVVS